MITSLIKALILNGLVLTSIAGAYADNTNYKYKQLRSKNVYIDISYKFKKQCYVYEGRDGRDHIVRVAAPTWIIVQGVGDNRRVETVVELWKFSDRRSGNGSPNLVRTEHDPKYEVLLPQGRGRYQADFGTLQVHHSVPTAANSWTMVQKIKVLVDGSPVIDPISGSEWFQVQMDDGVACI